MKKSAWYALALFLLIIIVAVVGITKFSSSKNRNQADSSASADSAVSDAAAEDQSSADIEQDASQEAEAAEQTEIPVATYTPESSAPTETIKPTSTPSPTQTPAPTPTPTPAPTQAPAPTGTKLSSGSFSSNTGTSLNLVVDYTITDAGNGNASVQLSISIKHWSLTTSALPGGIQVSIGGNSYSLSSPAINADGNSMVTTYVGAVTCPSVAQGSIPVSVTWNYRGSYSGQTLDTVTASATIG